MMDPIISSAVLLGLLVIYLGVGLWIFIGLFLLGITSLYFIGDFSLARIGAILEPRIWNSSMSWEIAAIPMFIWMGEIIFRTDISDRIFKGLSPFLSFIPGRLLHVNVAGCTLFAMVSGSSTATTATVGRITLGTLGKQGYDKNLLLGSLAGAGSLGLLIPPSIVLIIYGVLAEVSIVRLFAAGLVPGLLIASLFTCYIVFRALMRPSVAPVLDRSYGLKDYIQALQFLSPIILLVVVVLGGLYSGIVTPSEAAALGVATTMLIAVVLRQFSWDMLVESSMSAIKTSCMIVSILIAAAFLSTVIGYLHISSGLAEGIRSLGLSPYVLLLIISLFYIFLGLFLDGLSMLVMTLPITLPILMNAGFDPVWFGVYFVIMAELAVITPPVGLNLFVIQGLTGKPLGEVVKATVPFFFIMCLGALILAAFPAIALWLPKAIGV